MALLLAKSIATASQWCEDHVPHAEHMEGCQSLKTPKHSQDDVKDFEDVSGVLSSTSVILGQRAK